jgi:hypothetical protein
MEAETREPMEAETDGATDGDATNGRPAPAADQALEFQLTVPEAQALKAWLVKPAGDGSSALDDESLKAVMLKLSGALDYIEGVAKVRHELEQAGFPTDKLSDEQVAQLGHRISSAPLHRVAAR